jgi:hypothetical protein
MAIRVVTIVAPIFIDGESEIILGTKSMKKYYFLNKVK